MKMVRATPGGWDAMAETLKMPSRAALENRIYDRQGQSLLVKTALQMQEVSATTAFAEGVAQESGGVFLMLPNCEVVARDDLFEKFNSLYAEVGQLSSTFRDAVSDDEVNHKEKAELTVIGQNIHRTVQDLLALTFLIYCKERDS